MNGSFPVLPTKEILSYTISEGDVHCGVCHWWDNTAPRCSSKADGKHCLLLHMPVTLPSSNTQEKTTILDGTQLHHFHGNARSPTAAVVKDVLSRWQWEILEHPPYSPDISPGDYDLFVKVKEPLRGTRYNTRDERIRAIGRSIRKINKDERADGIRRLPNIWQKVINKRGGYTEGK